MWTAFRTLGLLLASLLAPPAQPPFSPPTPTAIRAKAKGTARVVFTFDDGPSHATTPRLLELLDRARIRAAFFVTGTRFSGPGITTRRNRQVLLDIHRSGHVVGNHTFSHKRMKLLSTRRQRQEILRNEDALQELLGTRPRYYRPPYGRGTPRELRVAAELGYVTVPWSIEVKDGAVRSPERLAEAILAGLRKHNGGIVLLHDTHVWSVDAFGLTLQGIERENVDRARQGVPPLRVVNPEELLDVTSPMESAQSARSALP